jgi:hypothetical protein
MFFSDETPELLQVAKFSSAEEEDGASSGTKCFSAKGGAGVSTEQKEDCQHHEQYAHCPQAVKQAVIHCSNTCVKYTKSLKSSQGGNKSSL